MPRLLPCGYVCCVATSRNRALHRIVKGIAQTIVSIPGLRVATSSAGTAIKQGTIGLVLLAWECAPDAHRQISLKIGYARNAQRNGNVLLVVTSSCGDIVGQLLVDLQMVPRSEIVKPMADVCEGLMYNLRGRAWRVHASPLKDRSGVLIFLSVEPTGKRAAADLALCVSQHGVAGCLPSRRMHTGCAQRIDRGLPTRNSRERGNQSAGSSWRHSAN
jgi:hypothetical protein